MRNKLVVVVDLGCLKAYNVDYDEFSTNPHLELISDLSTPEADGRLLDKLTDQAGRRRGGGGERGTTTSDAEMKNVRLEFQRRAINELAQNVNKIVKMNNGERSVYFAAIKEINNQIMNRLDPTVKGRIEKNLPEDLTKINGTKLLSHFDKVAAMY
jgi:Protein required for attachment to host cells